MFSRQLVWNKNWICFLLLPTREAPAPCGFPPGMTCLCCSSFRERLSKKQVCFQAFILSTQSVRVNKREVKVDLMRATPVLVENNRYKRDYVGKMF